MLHYDCLHFGVVGKKKTARKTNINILCALLSPPARCWQDTFAMPLLKVTFYARHHAMELQPRVVNASVQMEMYGHIAM